MDLPRLFIPSYGRANLIRNLTLRFLATAGYPKSKIYIMVASESEKEEYLKTCGDYCIIVGVKGLNEQRGFISQFADEGEFIVQMDDDVAGIKMMNNTRSFLDLIRDAVNQMVRANAGLYGVLPNDDARRFSDKTTSHLTHILGSFFICKNNRSLDTLLSHKEDYERSILYFLADGKVLRYRGAGVSTLYNKNIPGGLSDPNRKQQMEKDVDYLVRTYPEMLRRKDKKGFPDIELNWRYKKNQQATPKIESPTQPNLSTT